ncbi:hypothetical protein AHF37_03259 [Paragonimus kellicotti]|nr:hypothetical protein AHF37_03259 [Paragonimus kellicotti]
MQRAAVFYFCYKRYRIPLCLGSLFCLYAFLWFLSRIHFRPEFVKTEDRIKDFEKKISEFDAFVLRTDETDPRVMTFVGNGYIGSSFQHNDLIIYRSGFLPTLINISVLISLDVHGYLSDASFVLDVYDGVMYKMNCFKHENELCVSSGTMVYAHRIYTSLLIQNFRVYNPLDDDATVKVNKANVQNWKGVSTLRTIRLKQNNLPDDTNPHDVTYQVVSFLIEDPVNTTESDGIISHVTVVVLFEPVFPDNLTVGSGISQSYSFITGVRASAHPISVTKAELAQAASEFGPIGQERKALEAIVFTELVFALQFPEMELRKLHTTAWNRLWISGVTLSYSYAPKTLNGPQINSTLYYLTASIPDYFSAPNEGNVTTLTLYQQRAKRRTACAPKVDLLRSNEHWEPVRNLQNLQRLLKLWRSTLSEAKCDAFFEDGAHGVLQAILLNLGSFHLHEDYVSFGLAAETLTRDIQFRRIQLHHPGVYVNVELRIVPGELSLSSPHLMVVQLSAERPHRPPPLSMVAETKTLKLIPLLLTHPLDPHLIPPTKPIRINGEDEKSDLLVWAEHEAEAIPVFTCPAACLTTPVEVAHTKVVMPFLVTVPPSALMYFGTQHAGKLKTLTESHKYESVRPGPNPDHDLITLHKHGHAFGGLPWLFWISLGLMITLFHLFFCKIIYNELIRDKSDLESENAWRLPKYTFDLRSQQATSARALIKAELASRRRYNRLSDSIP